MRYIHYNKKNNNMKHLKPFDSTPSVNESKMTRAQIKNAMVVGDESIEAISAIKEDLLVNGVVTNLALTAAKMITWTPSEIAILVRKSEETFEDCANVLDLHNDGLIPPRDADEIRTLETILANKSRILDSLKQF
jgi:hypothetical protein